MKKIRVPGHVGSGVPEIGAPPFRQKLKKGVTVDFNKHPAQEVGLRSRAVSTQGLRQVCLSGALVESISQLVGNYPEVLLGNSLRKLRKEKIKIPRHSPGVVGTPGGTDRGLSREVSQGFPFFQATPLC